MTAVLLRLLVFAAIGLIILLGVRKIWRDWTGAFKAEDRVRRDRNLAERQRPDVIDLKRDGDGVFRPGPNERGGPDRKD